MISELLALIRKTEDRWDMGEISIKLYSNVSGSIRVGGNVICYFEGLSELKEQLNCKSMGLTK